MEVVGTCCCEPDWRTCGVACEEENFELMLLIQDGRRLPRASSSLLALLLEFVRLSKLGRLGCAFPAGSDGEGLLGWALVGFCFASEREGGVTATGAVFLWVSGVAWPSVCGAAALDWEGDLASLDRPGEAAELLRRCCSDLLLAEHPYQYAHRCQRTTSSEHATTRY